MIIQNRYRVLKSLTPVDTKQVVAGEIVQDLDKKNVFLGVDVQTGTFVVLKRLTIYSRHRQTMAYDSESKEEREGVLASQRAMNEIHFSRKMSLKPGFPSIHGVVEEAGATWMIMQYIIGGDLFDFLSSSWAERERRWKFYLMDKHHKAEKHDFFVNSPGPHPTVPRSDQHISLDLETDSFSDGYVTEWEANLTPAATAMGLHKPAEDGLLPKFNSKESSAPSEGDISRTSSGFESPRDGIILCDISETERRAYHHSIMRGIFWQMCQCLRACHKAHISHRDVKLENFCMDEQGNIFMIDFGYSCPFVEGSTVCDFVGTHYYVAPELAKGHIHRPEKADIWALGVCLYIMIFNDYPFRGNTAGEIFAKILAYRDMEALLGDRAEALEENEISLLMAMMDRNPDHRPSMSTIIHHAYFKKRRFLPRFASHELLSQIDSISAMATQPLGANEPIPKKKNVALPPGPVDIAQRLGAVFQKKK